MFYMSVSGGVSDSGRFQYFKILSMLKNQYQIEYANPTLKVDEEARTWIHCLLPSFMVKPHNLRPPSFPKEGRKMGTILISLLLFMP